MEYHVSKSGNDFNRGTLNEPFLTITKAASVVRECDIVIVHEGVYRECVIVETGAENPRKRITFQAAEGENVVIKGSEEIKNWQKYSEGVYKASVPNSIFREYNPYSVAIEGDWFYKPAEYKLHTGQVYVNGTSLREVPSVEAVKNNNWYAVVKETETEIYANFGPLNPNENLVEINVRESCFTTAGAAVNYITVSGFEMCHAATQWSPPTAEQSGLICVNWCKGWIIENNHIHDSRCNGICLGKEKSTGHNLHTRYHKRRGHYYQLESVFSGLQRGWSKEHVGSHIVRNNVIYNCGQAGIVGHMGCAFSEVYGNHIYNIQNTDEFYGDELGGIKFHAAIDTYIHHNNIHDCYRGMWLDWQSQGVRVSSNLFFNNMSGYDLYIEVTHGPLLVDNNLLLSKASVALYSQGNAFVHNLIAGAMLTCAQSRNTPYHFPHSTQVKGVTDIFAGDDRFYNNIFAAAHEDLKEHQAYGTCEYNDRKPTYEEFIERATEIFVQDLEEVVIPPVYINNNSYLAGAKAFIHEKNNCVANADPQIKVTEENGSFYIELTMPKDSFVSNTECICTENLPITWITEACYENPDGSDLVVDQDYLGNARCSTPTVGPFENLKAGTQKILLWK